MCHCSPSGVCCIIKAARMRGAHHSAGNMAATQELIATAHFGSSVPRVCRMTMCRCRRFTSEKGSRHEYSQGTNAQNSRHVSARLLGDFNCCQVPLQLSVCILMWKLFFLAAEFTESKRHFSSSSHVRSCFMGH